MSNQVVENTPMKLKKGFTGNRYSSGQKLKVVRFVKEYDTKHGRGGIAAAQREFKVSYIALRNWLMSGGPGARKAPLIKPVLSKLAVIRTQMRDLERDLRRIRPRA